MTFYVFEPRHIEDLLDRDLPAIWRDDDVQAASERRRRAAGKADLTLDKAMLQDVVRRKL